jgi:cysteine desulfurase / selenocysteine lyase
MPSITDIRKDFPILHTQVNGKPLVYLDNAATSQKPIQVIDALSNYYKTMNSNIHRSAHHLAAQATEAYEQTREAVRSFLNANSTKEINFVRGCTEAVNLVAYTWGRANITEGDEILVSALEHHSNLVPWMMLAKEKKANLLIIPIDAHGQIDVHAYQKQLNQRTKLVAVNHTSNSLGTINPIKDMIEKAHLFGAKVFIDGAQATPHGPVDVQALDCDFFCFSGHKTYAPTGIGVLYGKAHLMEEMTPFLYGGEMIKEVDYDSVTFNDLPYKFEAGTPNIADTIALGTALDYMKTVGYDVIRQQERFLLHDATEKLSSIAGLRIIGTAKEKSPVISFLLGNAHAYDVGVLLDKMGIAIRTGHHCCQPLMKSMGIDGTCRASFAFYNTVEEVDILVDGLLRVQRML